MISKLEKSIRAESVKKAQSEFWTHINQGLKMGWPTSGSSSELQKSLQAYFDQEIATKAADRAVTQFIASYHNLVYQFPGLLADEAEASEEQEHG